MMKQTKAVMKAKKSMPLVAKKMMPKKKATAKFTPGLTMLSNAMKSKKKPNYKIPKTPKTSGLGWGG